MLNYSKIAPAIKRLTPISKATVKVVTTIAPAMLIVASATSPTTCPVAIATSEVVSMVLSRMLVLSLTIQLL